MDGLKRRMKESLRVRLSVWLSAVIIGVALAAGTFAFLSAFEEANELQDDVLRQMAGLFDRHHLPASYQAEDPQPASGDEDARVVVQRLTNTAPVAGLRQPGVLELPADLPDGMQTVRVGAATHRVFVRTLASGDRIAVAQDAAVRHEIAQDSALRTLMPFVILMPLLLLVVNDIVRKMLIPIASLAAELDRRGDQGLNPLPADSLPSEIRPFVIAINRLLGRVADSMSAQQRFVADAAHELRSPLTALSLQAERLADAEMSAIAQDRLAELRRGIERNGNLLDQLLKLARVQASRGNSGEAVSLQRTIRSVLEELLPLADAKSIDMGMVSDIDAQVHATQVELSILVKNLVDNAIRYTPPGGRIDLAVRKLDEATLFEIEDSGPGIPESERDRVFDPFYRTLDNDEMGSGLGLSIVETIAQRLGATVELGYADEQMQSGLRVSVTFPFAGKPMEASRKLVRTP